MLSRFWQWYERNYVANVGFAAFLFSLQLVHLVWLTGHVVAARLLGEPLFTFTGTWEAVIVLVDYTEVPAIITTSLVFVYKLRERFNIRDLLMLLFLNSQWLHIFWITDEYVVERFAGSLATFPLWLAWVAILIDYLEIPVIYQTFKELFAAIKERDLARVKASFDE
jgi:hypothetical protein